MVVQHSATHLWWKQSTHKASDHKSKSPQSNHFTKRKREVVSRQRLHQSLQRTAPQGERLASDGLFRTPSGLHAALGILGWRNNLLSCCIGFTALTGLPSGISQIRKSCKHHYRNRNGAPRKGDQRGSIHGQKEIPSTLTSPTVTWPL